MDNFLVHYSRQYSMPDWMDSGEFIGDISFGLLSVGFGKRLDVKAMDGVNWNENEKLARHTFENCHQSISKRIALIALAVLFLPFTILFAGVGAIAYACSESRKYIRLCHEAGINNTPEPNKALFPHVVEQSPSGKPFNGW
jgi:hypothetical protein